MNPDYTKRIAAELGISQPQVANTIKLLDEGATIPFISRYRKEATGNLDEVQVQNIKEAYQRIVELEERRTAILTSIEKQGLLTPELSQKVKQAATLTDLEDLYLPYKPKRKTRASVAREKGLEPLAVSIMKQQNGSVSDWAAKFITDQVANIDEALQGARDIIAEWVNENTTARNIVRSSFDRTATISARLVKGKEAEGIKYKDYFDFSEPLKKSASHRLLAMMRAEKEGILRIGIEPETQETLDKLDKLVVKGLNDSARMVQEAVHDSYKRLMQPSIETEYMNAAKEKADAEAIRVFRENMRQLLLAAPLGEKRVLGMDPGFKSGCKIVCLDAQGNLVHNETIYPHPPQNDYKLASHKLASLVEMYKIEAIAIGNGTASRETESFVKNVPFRQTVQVFVVSENGASIYSASPIAREEFPDYDVTVRGAVSIGRRLMDPLAELVKIEPKSIGVGQYQHDVDQTKLGSALEQTVESCVNNVGVDLNTASKHLLTHVSGLGAQLAKNIVEYRRANGPFRSRAELKKVPRLGEKAFELAAGFLRIRNAENPLDNSAVHPESYPVVNKMAKDLGCTVPDLLKQDELRKKIAINQYVSDKIGLPTLTDIMAELAKPGRDPRQTIKVFEFSHEVRTIEDLKPGMILPGIVTNITQFGAFVDVGVKQDGLVHISQLANKYVSDPSQVVTLHQHVKVKVVEVDVARKRIQLSMKDAV